jgi:hypothetical protein
MNSLVIAVLFALSLCTGASQEKPRENPREKSQGMASCPMHEQHKASQDDEHLQGVVERGDHVMGFDHAKTTHHFRVYADGGAIEADAIDAQDTASRDAIRAHFGHIATMFAMGDFSAPMLIHQQNPPGTEAMKRLREAIQYNVANAERGARIRIVTKSPEALQAVHQFLRFQIADHQTGDALEVTKVP